MGYIKMWKAWDGVLAVAIALVVGRYYYDDALELWWGPWANQGNHFFLQMIAAYGAFRILSTLVRKITETDGVRYPVVATGMDISIAVLVGLVLG